MAETENKRPRRTPQERAAEVDSKIEKLNQSITEIEAKKQAVVAEYDTKIAAAQERIKALESKKQEILAPKPPRKPRKTKKQKIQEIVKLAMKSGMSVEEIAEHLGTSVEEVLDAMESSSAYSSVPLEGGGSSDDEEAPSVIDHYATEDADLAASDDRIVLEQAIADFSPREQDVIRMRFVDGLTQVEIAERLGISQVQVSRLLRRTLRRLQEKIDPEGIMGY